MKRYGYLIQEIIERDNLEASFDEVTCDLPKWSKEYYISHKEDIIKKLAECIGDDMVVLHGDKRMLWKIRDKIHDNTSEIGLTIKTDEAVRPLSEGLDFLGFVYDGKCAPVRKRTKHKFAKKMHEVKSRKRRVQLIGSFYGMAKWGDCRHLMKTILNKKIDMKEFKNLGLVYQPEDGKKRFDGKKYSLGQLVNLHIVILDFEVDVQTENGLRTLVHFQRDNGEKGKYFTSDKVQLQLLRMAKEKGVLPFGTTIGVENFGKGVRYTFN